MLPRRAGGIGGHDGQTVGGGDGDAITRNTAIRKPATSGLPGQRWRQRCQSLHQKLLGQNGCGLFNPMTELTSGGG
jgi:hypothetical protein